MIRSQIEYWQAQYPPAVAQQVEKIVKDAYEEVAVAQGVPPARADRHGLFRGRCATPCSINPALTTSLLGLISEDALIGPRTGKLGLKRKRADEADDAYLTYPTVPKDEPAA